MTDPYLAQSDVINWQHPAIQEQAKTLTDELSSPEEIAKACFEWVRDQIYHICDYRLDPVVWRASDVLQCRTGFCFAKSHLLAALLRANKIPTGFCYQRLSIDGRGAPYSLHGFNAVYLPEIGWYRLDPRGNRDGIQSAFNPPHEQLAYTPERAEEEDFKAILPEPLSIVVDALKGYSTREALLQHLPDVSLDKAAHWGLRLSQNLEPV